MPAASHAPTPAPIPTHPSAAASTIARASTPQRVPAIYARLLRMVLQQDQVDGDQVLRAAGQDWPSLLQQQDGLGLDTLVRLVQAAVAATGRPWLGLDLGSQVPVSAHGPMAYAAVTAPTLGHALAVLSRYAVLRNDSLLWRAQAGPEGLAVQATELADWGEARGFMMDTTIASLLRILEAALGHLPQGLKVGLPAPRPAWADQYQRFRTVAWEFGQAQLSVWADASTLALPVLGADATAHAAACQACDQALAAQAPQSLSQQLATQLARTPKGRYPTLGQIAQGLGLSTRTVIRRLAAEGSSFQSLIDQARQDQALWMLQHTHWPIDDIAARLGYADTSNFSRTARRWWGKTPGAMRMQSQNVEAQLGREMDGTPG